MSLKVDIRGKNIKRRTRIRNKVTKVFLETEEIVKLLNCFLLLIRFRIFGRSGKPSINNRTFSGTAENSRLVSWRKTTPISVVPVPVIGAEICPKSPAVKPNDVPVVPPVQEIEPASVEFQ